MTAPAIKDGKILIRNGKLFSSCGCWYIATFCPCGECLGSDGCEDGSACEGTARGYGEVAVVPHADADDETSCKYAKDYEYSRNGNYYPMNDACHVLVQLKGPFNTKSEAEYVLSTWEGLIEAYASTCSCAGTCSGDELSYSRENVVGPYYGDPSGDAGITPAPAGCMSGYTWYEWTVTVWGAGITAEFWIKDPVSGWEISGSVSSSGPLETKTESGVIPPCGEAKLMIRVTDGNTGSFSVGGNYGWVGQDDPCCISDPSSPYYGFAWDYDMETHEGVPSNSAELADYIESNS